MPTTAPAKSLLIIEDDLSLVELIDAMLSNVCPGLQWEYVTSGDEALKLIERRGSRAGHAPYSLVLTDIYLEGDVTGFDVWRDCQRTYPTMPFVVTSGLSYDRYFEQLRDLTNRPAFLPKPLTAQGCRPVFEEYLA